MLVHFFATWCEPCVEELAAIDRLAATGRVAVLAVDVGEVDDRVRRFLASHPVSFPVGLDRDLAVTRALERGGPAVELRPRRRAPGVGFAEGDLGWDDPGVTKRLDELIERGEAQNDDEPT